MFERKATQQLLAWKNRRNRQTVLLLEGAQRVGKRTLAQAFFFRRNQDAVNVLLDRKQRSGFDAVKTRISRNVLDEGASKWKVLDIAEKQQRFFRVKRDVIYGGKVLVEPLDVCAQFQKERLQVVRY